MYCPFLVALIFEMTLNIFRRSSAMTCESMRITQSHFGSNFQADSDRTVFWVLSKHLPKCGDDDALFILVGDASVDIRLRFQRCGVFGWKAGPFSVAQWCARFDGVPWLPPEPWRRGTRSTLAPLAAARPAVPSIWPPLHQCQCQYNQYKHHNQQYKQHKQQYKQHNQYQHRDHSIMHCNRIAVWSWQFHESCSSRKWKYNSLLEFQGPTAGCCVGSQVSVTAQINAVGETSGILAVFLETPTGQSELLGSVDDGLGFAFSSSSGIVFPGEVIAGVWKLIFLGSVDAANYVLSSSLLSIVSEQCVWLTWLCQERSWKGGGLQPHVEKLWAEVLVEAKQHLWSFAQTCEATKPFGLVSGVLMHNSKKHTSFERDL